MPIYKPKTPIRKFGASALTFLFIYLWHGMQLFVFIWALLNFLGVVIENIVKSYKTYFYKKVLNNKLSPQNQQRFECALATPLLVLSSLSSFYFFAGEQIGHIYVWRIFEGTALVQLKLTILRSLKKLTTFVLTESWKTICILFFILYCCCQTSTEIKKIEEANKTIKMDIKIKVN